MIVSDSEMWLAGPVGLLRLGHIRWGGGAGGRAVAGESGGGAVGRQGGGAAGQAVTVRSRIGVRLSSKVRGLGPRRSVAWIPQSPGGMA
jgi:hypothetical protein